MLDRKKRSELRARLFRHLDGIAIAPTMYALHSAGVLDHLLEQEEVHIGSLSEQFQANEGYLNVALRLLCSQGWLDQDLAPYPDVVYRTNARSPYAFALAMIYRPAVQLIRFSERFHPRRFEKEPFDRLEQLFRAHQQRFDLAAPKNDLEKRVQQQVLAHIEGIIVGPTAVHLGMTGMFHKYFMQTRFRPEEFHQDRESFKRLLDIFTTLGWFKEHSGTYEFTDKGFFYAKRASAYGVTVSYMPTFRHLDELIFGNPSILREVKEGEDELHVDRAMNVWGSGGAHATYFKAVDEMLIRIFDRPIEEQPKGILDMGCGNGAFLQHIFEVIEKHTQRGQMLDDHPLILVGADYNKTALEISKANLVQADVWAKMIWGDIGRPDLLAKDLNEFYGVDLSDLLNVRTFLDHNRIWDEPELPDELPNRLSTGAYVHRGNRLDNRHVEWSLQEHFGRWRPYVEKHGLMLIELHTLPPGLAAQHIGKTAVTAYDATHGYSDQYILERDVFQRILERSGWTFDAANQYKFPDSDLATVSVQLMKG